MEQNKKTLKSKPEFAFKSSMIRSAILKLAETEISKKELEVFIELSELIKKVIPIDDKAICGFLAIANELMQKEGRSIDYDKYNNIDLTSDDDIKELMVYFKRIIVLILINRIDIFQINERLDELFFDANYSKTDINNN